MKEAVRDKSKKDLAESPIKMDEFANALSIFAICVALISSDTEDRSVKC